MKIVNTLLFLIILSCFTATVYSDTPHELHELNLPDDIKLRTKTEAFNETYYFAIRDGRIYIKYRSIDAEWNLLGNEGLPRTELKKIITHDNMEEISIDGPVIIAISETGRVYYCKDGYDSPEDISWTDNWGAPLGAGPGIYLPGNVRSWALSQNDLDRNKFYHDQNGNVFPCMVTTIYYLSENGQEIHFADPWTPEDWGYRIASPFRDSFIAESLSAAASTIFLINKYGDMYTHQNDFDIGGGNPFFRYTYDDAVIYDTDDPSLIFILERQRRIPDQVWYNQPKINGRITKNITIIFPEEGEPGSGDRILRVEGEDESGNPGYYEKHIESMVWEFIEMPERVISETDFIENTSYDMSLETVGETTEYDFSGKMENIFGSVEAELIDFSLVSSPATLRLKVEDRWINLKMHHHLSLRSEVRENPGMDGDYVNLGGAIEVPEDIITSEDENIRKLLGKYFYISPGDKSKFVNIKIKAKTDSVSLQTTSLSAKMSFNDYLQQ